MNNAAPQLASGASADNSAASTLLPNARAEKNLTQEDIADRLFLNIAFIRYIDADQLDKISRPAFVRGYLRSYARLVGLDEDMVVKQYESSNNSLLVETASKSVANASLGSSTFTGPVFATAIVGLVALALVIGIVWYIYSDSASSTKPVNAANLPHVKMDPLADIPGPSNPAQDITLPPAASVPGVNNAAPVLADIEDENEPLNAPAAHTDAPANDDARPPEADPVFPVISKKPGEAQIINIDAGGDASLDFIFTDRCWLEVRDANEQLIYSDLGTAGLDIRIAGIAPFKVLIGNAPALTMRYQGKVIDLKPHTTSRQTATLDVGD